MCNDEEHIFNLYNRNCLRRLTNSSLDNFLISHSSSIVWYCYNQWQDTKGDNRELYNLADVLSPGRTSILFLPIKDNYILKHVLYGIKWFRALLLESSKERINSYKLQMCFSFGWHIHSLLPEFGHMKYKLKDKLKFHHVHMFTKYLMQTLDGLAAVYTYTIILCLPDSNWNKNTCTLMHTWYKLSLLTAMLFLMSSFWVLRRPEHIADSHS